MSFYRLHGRQNMETSLLSTVSGLMKLVLMTRRTKGKGDGVQSGRHVFVERLSSKGRGFLFSLHSHLKELLPLIFLEDQ